VIRLRDVILAPGGQDVIRGASWHLHPGQKVGLVGRNGCGKTTLLRAMAGELEPEHGNVHLRSKIRLGWLPQHVVAGSTRTVWEEARAGMTRILDLGAALVAAEDAVAREEDGAVARLDAASEVFRMAGGYAQDERVGEVLHGLGFGPDTWHRPCDTFSGGWQMRIALGRMLLSDPDVALLDEPTNHLDLVARGWLASFLASREWGMVIVSHDRWVLDRVVDHVVEVRRGKLHSFKGNLTAWLKERAARRVHQEAAYARQQSDIAKLERFVERFGAKATKAAQARSKQKQLDRMVRLDGPERLEALPKLSFPESPAGAHITMSLDGASVGWPGEADLLTGIDLELYRGMRLVILGPNGCGKSTLLHLLTGKLRPRAGRRVRGDRLRLGVFDQDLASTLPPEQTPLHYLTELAPAVPPQKLRATLGALGLPGDMALRPIEALSGGERARAALAGLVVRPHNCLLLDEPTNHLDAETVEVLVRALKAYDGALVLVTHDRYLARSVATHVARVRDGKVEVHEGVREEDLAAETVRRGGDEEASAGAVSHAERKAAKRRVERARRRIGELEELIAESESAVKRVEEALFEHGADYERAAALETERAAAEGRVEALYEEWEQLESTLAD